MVDTDDSPCHGDEEMRSWLIVKVRSEEAIIQEARRRKLVYEDRLRKINLAIHKQEQSCHQAK